VKPPQARVGALSTLQYLHFCDMLKGAHAVILALFDFAKGVSSGHADTMLWLM